MAPRLGGFSFDFVPAILKTLYRNTKRNLGTRSEGKKLAGEFLVVGLRGEGAELICVVAGSEI